jgi:hypothetical protein
VAGRDEVSAVQESMLAVKSEVFVVEKVGAALESYAIRFPQVEMMRACSKIIKYEGINLGQEK